MSHLHPDACLITGTKDDPEDGSLRVYISRGNVGLHTHIPADQRDKVLLGPIHTYAIIPREAYCLCPEPEESAADASHDR